jgi:DNA polymerase-3 subunit gamma/tau
VISPNNLEQKFIETERNGLTDFLQKAFNNKQLQYSLRVDEQSNVHDDLPIPPNAKEQFIRIAEEYPLVRVLKEKLKLDLDY